MKVNQIRSCYIGPEISPEQFTPQHFFLYIAKGRIHGYDGHTYQSITSGECCLVRKNHLARYNKERINDEFEKVVIIFDEAFLKKFLEKHATKIIKFKSDEAFLKIENKKLILEFIQSLMPYYIRAGKIDKEFADLKREELLMTLLRNQPELSGILFDFGIPGKIDLEKFMTKNYKFNVSLDRFAYLTGRSLSSFKRDFEKTFNETPSHWLVQKRLDEAYFLIEKKNEKASDIYLDLGFEDLSHFSYAFKKSFGISPNQVKKG